MTRLTTAAVAFGLFGVKSVLGSIAAKIAIMPASSYVDYPSGELIAYDYPVDLVEPVAAIMAGYYCETGDSSLIPSIADFEKDCPSLDFQFEGGDSQYENPVGVQNFVDHWSEGFTFVIGASMSSSTMPLAMVAGALDVGVISFWSTSSELSNRDNFGLFARTIPSDGETAEMLVKLVDKYGIDQIGMIYSEESYGSAYRDAVLKATDDLGIKLFSLGYRVGSESSTVPLVMGELKKRGLNVIIAVAFDTAAEIMIDYMVENDMHGPGKLVVFTDSVGLAFANYLTDDGKNEKYTNFLLGQQFVVANGGDESSSHFRKFQKAWADAGENPALVQFINDRLPGGSRFAAPRGPSYNVSITTDFFNNTVDFIDRIAPFAFDATIAACRATCLGHKYDTKLSGTSAFKSLDNGNLTFIGTSGTVQFDPDTGARTGTSTSYKAMSIVQSDDGPLTWIQGAWIENGDWVLMDGLKYPGGVTTMPTTTDPVDIEYNHIDLGLKIVAYIIMAIVEILCLYFLVWVVLNRRNKNVIKSQPQFLNIFLIGTMISTASIYFLSVDDGPPHDQDGKEATIACHVSWSLWSMGSTIVTSALLVKLYRILRIFKNPSLRTLSISNCDLYRKILALLLVDVFILTLWFTINPQVWVRYGSEGRNLELDQEAGLIAVDNFDRVTNSFGECQAADGSSSTVFIALLLVYNFGLFAAAAFICYKVRHVDSDFQESAYFFLAMFSQLQLYALGLPVILAIDPASTGVRFLILTILIAVNNLVLVCLLMVPKVMNVNFMATSNNTANQTAQATGHAGTSSLSRYECTKEEIYTIYDDEEEFPDASKFQRPSISFHEMYGKGQSSSSGGAVVAPDPARDAANASNISQNPEATGPLPEQVDTKHVAMA